MAASKLTSISPDRAGLTLSCIGEEFLPSVDYRVAEDLNRISFAQVSKKFTALEVKGIFQLLKVVGLVEIAIKQGNSIVNYWDLTDENIGNVCFLATLTEKGILYLKGGIEESPLVAVVRG